MTKSNVIIRELWLIKCSRKPFLTDLGYLAEDQKEMNFCWD